MGIGSMLFSIPHFIGEANPGIMLDNKTADNICRLVSIREQDMGLGRFGHQISKLPNPALATHNNIRYFIAIKLNLTFFLFLLLFFLF
jgi:solute carrier organic anion transporter family, member 3A